LSGFVKVEPASQLFQQFIINEVQEAMRVDALETSHPIYMPIHQLEDISQIFDKITYNKGIGVAKRELNGCRNA
jgi:aminopeptidase N